MNTKTVTEATSISMNKSGLEVPTTDDIMRISAYNLRVDMHVALGHDLEESMRLARLTPDIRERQFLLHDGLTPYQYKWGAQIQSFLKRYTFLDESITPKEREEITNEKFLRLQENLASSYSKQRSYRCHEVLRHARAIVKEILDGYPPDVLAEVGRFGTKATNGCPASDAYIDHKLQKRQITGSAAHIQWFQNSLLPADKLLAECVAQNKRGYTIVTELEQVNVPKKYNIDRGINPNTLIGSLYTDCLGKILVAALRNQGLDIRKLQQRHRRIVKSASRQQHERPGTGLATADLSDASHGFLSSLLNALLPRKWYRAVMKGVIRQVKVNGRVSRLESIMTMGIGFTFPMQTLLFYSLLMSLQKLTGIHGKVSVYGDDLIFPCKLYPYVVGIFSDLGFKLNKDKTFVQSPFRESCGSDFFRGVDVRPFSPEGRCETDTPTYTWAFCYKLLNGLLSRFTAYEIPGTISGILTAMVWNDCPHRILVVEDNMPEDSGLRVRYWNDVVAATGSWPSEAWTWDEDTHSYAYPILSQRIPRHYVSSHLPFYWDKLRSIHTREFEWERAVRLPDVMGTALFKFRRLSKGRLKSLGIRLNPDGSRSYASVASKAVHVARYEVALHRPVIRR